jgi:S-DNA-T family DNA segregation ATPase FtsK/SpoIIIE
MFHFLAAVPAIDADGDPGQLADGLDRLVKAVAAGWSGDTAPRVRMLPDRLPYARLPEATVPGPVIPIGIAEEDLTPVFLDFAAHPHLLLFGDVECGKTTFLRTVAEGITRRMPRTEARIILIDHRRGMLGAVDPDYLLGYGSSAKVTDDIIAQVTVAMRERLPSPDVTPEQLRSRDWWQGPQLYLLVDDYDMVATGLTNPLAPLVEFLPQGRDIGLHVVVARRAGGASRALFDPVIGAIRDTASAGIVMSGSKEEGALIGTVKPQPLPPGRGYLVTRREGARLVQLASCEPVAGQ